MKQQISKQQISKQQISKQGKAWAFVQSNPVPLLALAGLLAGLLLLFGLHLPVPARWVWLATLILGGAPLVWRTGRGMLQGKFASDVVAMLAVVTAIIMDQAFAGVIIVLMQSGGEGLENYCLRRASSSLDLLMARAPQTAQRREEAGLKEVDVTEVRPGDTLVVRPGDLIPVDGALLSDRADVDESALTGEPVPRAKHPEDSLLSGSVNTGSAFEMRAEKVSADSQYSKIVQLVRQAQEEKPPLQRLADKYAVWFTPLTLAMCGIGWWWTGEPQTILAVLVVATPCPLILAVPVAIISAINRAASLGIIVKGGTALEQIATAQAFVFDKTGTLTQGTPVVEKVIPFNGAAPQELLYTAGSVEQLSAHPLGQTLAAAARAEGKVLTMPTGFLEVAGRGVEADVDGQHVLVGSPRFLQERVGGSGPPQDSREGSLEAYVAIAGKPAGVIRLNDKLRPGVEEMLRRLKGLGVQHTVMLTGDNAANAKAIGAEAGIDEIKAQLLPEDKVTALKALKAQYEPIIMVGDGINDAPALATATVGIAMGAHGTGISAEAAGIVLLVDDVTKVADAMEIGKRMVRIAKQSICVGLGLSLACMVVATLGKIPPVTGALLQEVIDVAVILNALRAR
jgi:heavy metal translocating P-type ATPase